nr:MAG TPA: hypothetical protein [Caudoviricetes sp.]
MKNDTFISYFLLKYHIFIALCNTNATQFF